MNVAMYVRNCMLAPRWSWRRHLRQMDREVAMSQVIITEICIEEEWPSGN